MLRRVFGGALVGAALFFVVLAGSASASGGPPGGVWTCGYIAEHPLQAAAALVSCDARGPVLAPGVTPAAAVEGPSAAFFDPPCEHLPLGGGAVSRGVFAWSNLHYFNYFSYSPAVIQTFTWYVQKTDGTNVQWGTANSTNSHPVNVGYNYYWWGAQNNGDQVQSWTFCWSSFDG